MQRQTKNLFIVSLLVLATLAASPICQKGQVRSQYTCIQCKSLDYVAVNDVDSFKEANSCPCIQGYSWSKALLRCAPVQASTDRLIQYPEDELMDQQGEGQVSRLLQTCERSLGLITLSSNCVNCRSIPYAMGVALSSTGCTCSGSFQWRSSRCYCGYYNYIDGRTNTCNPCTVLGSSLLLTCRDCAAPMFIRGNSRCVYCPSLANNGGNTSCCATGFRFNPVVHQCLCDLGQGFAVNSNGVCSRCATGDTNCTGCRNSYVRNNLFCIHGSLIPNYDLSRSACRSGHTFKNDLFNNQRISCVCDRTAGSYIGSAGGCLSCSSSPPSGVASADCTACSLSSGFYSSPTECFFCSALANTAGSPTASGCTCKPNYFWNANTGNCECDWSLGFVGGAISQCVDCSALPNTAQTVVPNACSCEEGYRWNPLSLSCECNTQSPSVFQLGNLCIDCSQIPGSSGNVGSDLVSCECISMYFWNKGTNKCECDSSSNFVVFPNSYCTDCALATLGTGLAYAGKCICQNNFVWNSATSGCGCPQGYALFGTTCTSCSIAAAASSGAYTASTCTDCTDNGWKKQDGVCVYCPSQSNNCNECPTGQKWVPTLGGCVCDWGQTYVTQLNSTMSPFRCAECPLRSQDTEECLCGLKSFVLNSKFNICTQLNTDPNANQAGRCSDGMGYSQASYPFKCTPSFSAGSYFSNGDSPTYPLCSSLNATMAPLCRTCDPTGGFIILPGINTCLYCASLLSSTATGRATPNGCECKSGHTWNPVALKCIQITCSGGTILNPITSTCDLCDPLRSIIVNDACTPCANDANSNGFAVSSSQCGCKIGLRWSRLTNLCKAQSVTCDLTQNVIIGSICFACPDTDHGVGTATDGACDCEDGYTWQFGRIDGKCICNATTSFQVTNDDGTTCYTCPVTSSTTGLVDGRGGCQCKNNFVWSSSSNDCECDSATSILTSSGICFQCSTAIDRNFDGTTTNGNCRCVNGFSFAVSGDGGSCVCNSPNIVRSNNCVSCPENANTTASFDPNGNCECKNNYVWSAERSTCLCDSSVKAIILPGTTTCFQCVTTNDPNFDGTITNGRCNCNNGLTFVATTTGANCTCDGATSFIASDRSCNRCPANQFTTAVGNGNNGCVCLSNYVWSATSASCVCESSVSAIILGNGSCFVCSAANNLNFDGTIVSSSCNCGNGFTSVTVNGVPSCRCEKTLTTNISCFDCPDSSKDPNSQGTSDGRGGCVCINGYEWNGPRAACICDLTTSILINGKCLRCGTTGTFTTTRRNSTACNCATAAGVTLTWDLAAMTCDCGSRRVIRTTGNTFTCVTCNNQVNAVSKNTSTACNCISTLTWNPTTFRCECGSTQVLFRSTCVSCDASRYATGVTTTTPRGCVCRNADMTWDATVGFCVCTNTSRVLFVVSSVLSCRPCGADTLSTAGRRSTPFSCKCPTGSVWQANIGCGCPGQNVIPVMRGTTLRCLTCDILVYSSGAASDQRSCTCLGSLTWNPTTGSCACNSTSVIAVNDGVYSCVACNASIFASAVRNATECRCLSTRLVWSPQGFCGCQDNVNQIISGSGASASCVPCNSTINAAGRFNATSCSCISDVLTYNNGICDCGAGRAFIIQGTSVFSCVNCNNAITYTSSKKGPSQCNCVSSKLFWDPSSGACNCNNSLMIVVGAGSSASCSLCTGQYVSTIVNITTCSCLGTGLVFSSTPTLVCRCPAGSIIKPDFTCMPCPTGATVNTPFECLCPAGSIWNNLISACQRCGTDIPNSVAAGSTSMACNCTAGSYWNVITLKCASSCNFEDDPICMGCPQLPKAIGVYPVALDNTKVNNPTGSNTIRTANSASFTNYASVSSFMCQCDSGYKWDSGRLRCLDQRFI